MLQSPPNLWLEDHDNGDDPPVDDLIHHPRNRAESDIPTDQLNQDDNQNPFEQLHGLSPANQHQQLIDQKPDD